MVQAFDATAGSATPKTGSAWWLALRTVGNLRKGLGWAWLDTVCQYRRSKIGPLWETINVLVMTLGITVVSTAIFGGAVTNLMGYIGLGIIIWSAITAFVLDGSMTFVRNREYILASNLSVDYYIARTMFRALITFGHHLVLYVIGVAVGLVTLHWIALLALPGILLLFANGYWIVTLLALIVARFRDVDLITRNLLQLAFFVTPIFWDYRTVPTSRAFVVDYNVLFYFIEIVRAPLLGQVPPVKYYVVVLAVTVIGFLLAYAAYRRLRRRLAFFV
jgi:ABC-type polysaccharide/polyol phosphate export permease